MEPVFICQSRKRRAKSLTGSLLACLLFLFILLFDWENNFEIIRILTVIGLPVYLVSSLFHLSMLLRRDQTLLRIDQQGITDQSGWLAVGRVSWEEIGQAQQVLFNNQSYLRLEIRDFSALLGRIPPLKRAAVRFRAWLIHSQGCVSVNLQQADQAPQEVLQQIQSVRNPQHPQAGQDNPQKAASGRTGAAFSKYDQ